jgi:hypothetical protein
LVGPSEAFQFSSRRRTSVHASPRRPRNFGESHLRPHTHEAVPDKGTPPTRIAAIADRTQVRLALFREFGRTDCVSRPIGLPRLFGRFGERGDGVTNKRKGIGRRGGRLLRPIRGACRSNSPLDQDIPSSAIPATKAVMDGGDGGEKIGILVPFSSRLQSPFETKLLRFGTHDRLPSDNDQSAHEATDEPPRSFHKDIGALILPPTRCSQPTASPGFVPHNRICGHSPQRQRLD